MEMKWKLLNCSHLKWKSSLFRYVAFSLLFLLILHNIGISWLGSVIMITEKMLRYFAYNFRVSEVLTLTTCRPFSWNSHTNKLELTRGVEFALYRGCNFGVILAAVIISYRLVKALWLNSVNVFGVIIAIGYACLLWTAGSLMTLMIQRREEFATWLNSSVQLDRKLKRFFPAAYLQALGSQRKKITHFEGLFKTIFYFHWTINWGIVAIFFEKFDPFHRFFVEYIGIKPRWNGMFIPFALGEAWFGYLLAHTCAIFMAVSVLYIAMELWLISFTNRIGTPLERPVGVQKIAMGAAYLQFYRCQQVLSSVTYCFTASFLITVHHACFMIAHIVGNYAIMTGTSDSSVVMRIAPVIVAPIGYWATYAEITLVSNFRDASENFLKKCRVHYGTDRYLRRGFKACKPIKIWTGYPFFCIQSKAFFIVFVRLIVEMTINLKLSLP